MSSSPLLFGVICSILVTLSSEIEATTRPYARGITYRKKEPVCLHGKVVDNKCACEIDYVGSHCEKKKNCDTFRRYKNGSCPSCLPGYSGDFCEVLNCVHGDVNWMHTACTCDTPYTGILCDELITSNVYSYYNKRVYWLGPLGALSLLPMIGMYIGCEYMAKKRQLDRVGNMLMGQNMTLKRSTLRRMLNSAEKPPVDV